MATPTRIAVKDLVAGGRYLHVNGQFIRYIDVIEGDTVVYHDQFGQGRCSRRAFLKACPIVASAEAQDQAKQQLLENLRATSGDEFTLRDEANALTAYAFRNGFLEDLHAGKSSPLLDQPELSRITNDEMRQLMIEASAKLAQMLQLKQADPVKYEIFIRGYQKMYCRAWKRD